jgi:hypothetical protein
MKGRDYSVDLSVDGKVIFREIFKNDSSLPYVFMAQYLIN